MIECNVILISGGKDSTATALLAIKRNATNIKFVFADTGNEHKITYEHIDYLSDYLKKTTGQSINIVKADFSKKIIEKRNKLIKHLLELSSGREGLNLNDYTFSMLERMIDSLKPTGIPYLDLCIFKGRFPGTRSSFCTTELKHNPINSFHESLMGSYSAIISHQGVRRDESKKRSCLQEKDIEFGSWDPEPKGLLIYRPILDWSARDCFNIHKEFGIKWNPLYEKGMGRVGCMPCINANKREIREINRRYPEELERISEWEMKVSRAAKRGESTFMDARVTAKYLGTGKTVNDINHKTHGIMTYRNYAMTEYGGRQESLIHAIELQEIPECSSVYGLCE